MTVTLQFANAVRRLGRNGMNVDEIATILARPLADIMETLQMLGLPLPGERAERRPMTRSDEERAALRDKMPKRWQDRRDKGKRDRS